MTDLKAVYNNTTTNTTHSFTVSLESNKTLTESIVFLQNQINTFLTHTLENERKSTTVPTVQEDEAEKQQQEEEEALEEEEEKKDESMSLDRPELTEEQVVKKQKTGDS